jgi:hypothetical protein
VFSEHAVLTDRAIDRLPAQARDALERALPFADGVCQTLDVRFDSIPEDNPVPPCVPYSALPAIAGDHSAIALGEAPGHHGVPAKAAFASLRRVTIAIGPRLVRTARSSWLDAHALSSRQRMDEEERVTIARDLDIALALRQEGYTTLAEKSGGTHFMPAGLSLPEVLDQLHDGRVDNAFAQFLVRHLRALQLAVRARRAEDPSGLLKQALFEHAYSLHFLQDVFAAGHLTPGACTRSLERMGPHNYYSRQGLAITFASADTPCHLEQPSAEPQCWTTRGDFYLPVREDHWESRKAAIALARAQLHVAIAIDPSWFVEQYAATDAAAPLRRAQLHRLLLGVPSYTPLATLGPEHSDEAVKEDMQRVLAALRELATRQPMAPVSSLARPAADTPDSVTDTMRAVPRDVLQTEVEGLALLARAVTEAWPVPQAGAEAWSGRDAVYEGWAVQLRGTLSALQGQHQDDWLRGFGVNASVGLSYRVMGLIPGFANRPFFELNVGLSYLRPTDFPQQRELGAQMAPLWRAELRLPVLWLGAVSLLNGATHNLDMPGLNIKSSASTFELLSGASVTFDSDVRVRMWDLELAAIRTGTKRIVEGDTREIFIPLQFDLHLGWWRPAIAGKGDLPDWDLYLGVGVSGGYAHFL